MAETDARADEADKNLEEANGRLAEADRNWEDANGRLAEADRKLEEVMRRVEGADEKLEQAIRRVAEVMPAGERSNTGAEVVRRATPKAESRKVDTSRPEKVSIQNVERSNERIPSS